MSPEPRALTLDTASGLPIYRHIVDWVKLIVAGRTLTPGSQLPTVRQLAVDLGVNINTVARAYMELERMGVVHTLRGKGTFVAEQTQTEGWAEHQAREVLENAVTKCRELGLNDGEVWDLVEDLLEER